MNEEDAITCPHCFKQTTIYPVMMEFNEGKGRIFCKCKHCEGGILLKEIAQ